MLQVLTLANTPVKGYERTHWVWKWCTTPSGHCREPDFSDKPKNEGWWQFPKGLSSCDRSGIGSLLSAGLFFHDTGRYALQRAASGLLQRPGLQRVRRVRGWSGCGIIMWCVASKWMMILALFDSQFWWENYIHEITIPWDLRLKLLWQVYTSVVWMSDSANYGCDFWIPRPFLDAPTRFYMVLPEPPEGYQIWILKNWNILIQ